MAGEVFKVTNLTDHFVGEEVRGSQGLKWPKTHYGVLVLLGEEPRDGSQPLNLEAAMAALGYRPLVGTARVDDMCHCGHFRDWHFYGDQNCFAMGGKCHCARFHLKVTDGNQGTKQETATPSVGDTPT
jgi:hypothetical protein